VALVPQPPVPPLSPPGGPAPQSGPWLGIAAVVLAVASLISAFGKEIAARWRGIVVAHLFFLTLWLAVQVFFFATGAYWCVPSNGSKFVQWLTMSFTHVARCGPALAPRWSPWHGSVAVAAQAPPAEAAASPAVPATPPPVAAAPPGAAVAATPPPAAVAATPPAPAVAATPPAPATATPPAPAAAGSPPPPGAAQGWSAKSIANCWRNRAVDGGDCYEIADPRRTTPPPRPRYRYPAYALRPPPPDPCRRRPYDCWGFWPYDDGP
jgi:hypothetical protein